MSLISASELSGRIGDPDLVVADCRWYLGLPDDGQAAYRAGHIPTAAFVDLGTV
ncbi:MAG: sulfurtransferase, partial [Armatimonadetes bacterium]